MKHLIILLAMILPLLAGAQIVEHVAMNQTPAPTINHTGTFTAFTTTAGTPSADQTFTFVGAHLVASVTWTAGPGMEVSTDGTTWGPTAVYTQSGGNASGTVHNRITAIATVGPYSGSTSATTTGGTDPGPSYTATVTAAPVSAGWNFSQTSQTVAGWNNIFGDPNLGQSATDGATGWQLQALAGQWDKFAGSVFGSNGDGGSSTGGTYGPTFPSTVVAGTYVNITFFSGPSNYNLQINNLPTGNYTVTVIGSIKSGIIASGTIEYDLRFGTGTNTQMLLNVQDNTQTTKSWTGNITSGQSIQFGVFQPAGGNPAFGVINAVYVTKN